MDYSDWSALGGTFSLSLACVECRTWGTLVASADFPDDLGELLGDLKDFNPLNDASLSVGFQGVGALVDLSVTTKGSGQFTIPLFVAETPLGISGPGFQVGITFGVDLVLGITGEIQAESGFQASIADGSSFTIPLDPSVKNIAKLCVDSFFSSPLGPIFFLVLSISPSHNFLSDETHQPV